MKYKVVYFSRTGVSRRIAEKIRKDLGCEIIEIKDNTNWRGAIGFIKGGYYASKNKDVKIVMDQKSDDADEIVVVTPLWAGGVAPAIKKYLNNKELEKIHLVVTSSGSTLTKRQSFGSISDIVKKQKNEDQIILELVAKLKKKESDRVF
jgi:flavodoxin